MATDPTYAAVIAQMTAFVNAQDTYLNQRIALDSGTADHIAYLADGSTVDPTQPGPGYYPITNSQGVVLWLPCIALVRALSLSLNAKFVQLNYTAGFLGSNNSYTLKLSDSGWLYWLTGSTATTAVTLTLPQGAPVGWQCMIGQPNTGKISFAVQTGDKLLNRQAFTSLAGQNSICSLIAVNRTGGGQTSYAFNGDLAA